MTVSDLYPFVDTMTKQAIAGYSDHGRATGDWKPLLHQMSQALNQELLRGPFFFHAEMLIKQKRAYNWCIVEIDYDNIRWLEKFLTSIGGYPWVAERYRAAQSRTTGQYAECVWSGSDFKLGSTFF